MRRRAGICLLLVLLVWAVFGQTVGFDFINCDDNVFVYQNPLVMNGLRADSVRQVLTSIRDTFYYPLTVLSFMIDAEIYGMNPSGFHLSNLLLHTGSVLLLFWFLVRLTGSFWKSAAVASLFAIHPLQVEAVAWVTGRKDVLSGVFFMLTLHAYLSYVRQNAFSLIRYSAVFLLFFAGLMAKPMLVTLPAVLLLLDGWPLKRFESHGRRVILEKAPLFFLSAVFVWISLSATTTIKDGTSVVQPMLSWRIGNALISCAVYLRQAVLPFGLGMPYPKYEIHAALLIRCIVLLLLLSGSLVYFRKRRPALWVGWLWFLGMLVPVIGIVRFLGVARADRFVYLPCIGLFMVFVWGAGQLPLDHRYKKGLAGLFIILFALVAHRQTGYWRNNLTLWSRSLSATGESTMAYINLGAAFVDVKEIESAEICFRKALKLDPEDQEALYNLGWLRIKSNRLDEGIPYLKRVIELNPERFDAHLTLGAAYIAKGDIDAGASLTRRALELRPGDPGALKNLEAAEAGRAEKTNGEAD
ncbi:MAG: tetratricopeptide repeat protein [Pontiellaceae bacterium]|nr:tetratricopeptide repeat protein [Pontiellaceae bacterium]